MEASIFQLVLIVLYGFLLTLKKLNNVWNLSTGNSGFCYRINPR